MKAILYILFVLNCAVSFSNGQLYIKRTNNNFTSEISIIKEKYLEGEDINLLVIFKNVSNKPDSLSQLNSYDILRNLRIVNEKNEPAIYKGVFACYGNIIYTFFHPGDTKSFSVRIMSDYGFAKEHADYKICEMNYYFPKGRYLIQYIDGSSFSNKIEFEVETSSGNEGKAWEELKSIYSIETPRNAGIREKALSLIDFAQKNKESVYSEQAFYIGSLNLVISTNGWLIDDNYLDKCKWFINTFPNSMYINPIVWAAAYAVSKLTNNKYSVSNFLNKIIADYSGTGAAISANEYLKYDFMR